MAKRIPKLILILAAIGTVGSAITATCIPMFKEFLASLGDIATAMALIFVWVGLVWQKEELELQREELARQREEVGRLASEAAKSGLREELAMQRAEAAHSPALRLTGQSDGSRVHVRLENAGAPVTDAFVWAYPAGRAGTQVFETHMLDRGQGESFHLDLIDLAPPGCVLTVSFCRGDGETREQSWQLTHSPEYGVGSVGLGSNFDVATHLSRASHGDGGEGAALR